MLTGQQTDSLKRALDFIVNFYDELPENEPELTADVVSLIEAFREIDFAFAEQLLNVIQAPPAEPKLPL